MLEDRTLLSGTTFNFSVDGAVTLNGAGTVDAADVFGLSEDQLASDDPVFEVVFDGSDVGLDGANVDAFAFLDDGSLLLSFAGTTTVGDLTLDGSDVVRFTPTSLGQQTAGTFSMFLDGSRLGLVGQAGNVDAIDVLADGSVVFSTEGFASVTGTNGTLAVRDADLVRLSPSADGTFADSEVSFHRTGGELGLTFPSEDVDALSVDEGGTLLLSTFGSFGIPGLSGSREDVFRLRDEGEEFVPSLPFDGGTVVPELRSLGLNVVGFDVRVVAEDELPPPVAGDVTANGSEDEAVVVQLLGDHADPDAELRYEVVDGPQNGSFTLNEETGELVYVPDENFHGEDSLTYRVVVVGANGETVASETATVSLTVEPVNDAPVVTVGESVVGPEDQAVAVPGISVADVDTTGELQVVLEVRNGRLTLDPAAVDGASVVGNQTSRVVLVGNVAQLNALLAGLTYKGLLDFSGQDRVLVRVTDPGDGTGPALEVAAEQQLVIQSTRTQAKDLRGRVVELVGDGEINRRHGRLFKALLSFGGSQSRFSQARVRVFLRIVDRLERRGRLSAEVAAELRTSGQSLLASLQTVNRRPWWWRRWR